MTTNEKLEKAIDFIKSIEQLDVPCIMTSDITNNMHAYCEECGQECDIEIAYPQKYVEATAIDELKDKAWHLLADLA